MGIGSLVGGALPAGVIADRFGEKKSLVGAMMLDAVCLLICAFATSEWVLAGAVFVIGLSGAMLTLARQSYLTVAVPLAYRARALSTLGGVFRIGNLVGPLMGAAVVTVWGLQAAYLVAAGTSLLAMVVTLALPELPAEPDSVDEPVRMLHVLRGHARVFATAGVGGVCLDVGARVTRRSAAAVVRADRLGRRDHQPDFRVSSGIDMTLFYVGGSVMDRFGRRWGGGACHRDHGCLLRSVAAGPRHPGGRTDRRGARPGQRHLGRRGAHHRLGSFTRARTAAVSGRLAAHHRHRPGRRTRADHHRGRVAPLGLAAVTIGAIGLAGSGWLWKWYRRRWVGPIHRACFAFRLKR